MSPATATIVTSTGLTVRRTTPTATAVKYAISNKPTRRTFQSSLRIGFRGLCVLVFLFVLLHRAIPLSTTLPLPWTQFTISIDRKVSVSTPSSIFSISLDIALIFAALLLGVSFLPREYTEESMLVMHDFGIQVSSTGTTRLSRTSQFIPLELIQDVVLHEGFTGFSVIYFLAVVVKGRSRLLVVFPNLLPKREILEEIWRDIRSRMHQRSVSLSVGSNPYVDEST
ncbi:phosphatidylinositol N-acetylglucosaminyltransferase [Lipomyces tetrasporus]|uniref:Phosphatidylinositol N-acetylglucosaminyltransferase n=1 Tax=Lipomyces tetrasporus TaxID=54092 RepID=A0AAD7QYY6_9ASCO|nr:phosphatidylinositol N-acetylglucosaminyltransferase [Lipomyces tetrasporus]KAJ8103996.1 phosphatidylinositol N-acetylglucosaminyltransferase [Lipomyces tetrasporus]